METEKHVLKGEMKDKKIKGSVLGGSASSEGESSLGVSTSGSASGDLFSGELDGNFHIGTTVKYDKDKKLKDATLVDVSVSGKGNVATGKLAGSYGYLHGDAEASAGAVSGKLGANVTLYEDGKLRPHIEAGGKVTADAAKGSASATVGTDEYDVHVKADGELGHAEAKGQFRAGIIEKEDANGNKTTERGVGMEFGAEAYLAKGTLSGGVNVMGVKVDLSVEGKVGGAGATADAQVASGGLSAGLGLGALLGLGVNVTVDWSGFKWPWAKDDKETETDTADSKAGKTTADSGTRPVDLCVYPSKLESCAGALDVLSNEISKLEKQVESVKNGFSSDVSFMSVMFTLLNITSQMKTEKDNFAKMSGVLTEISKKYTDTEEEIMAAETT